MRVITLKRLAFKDLFWQRNTPILEHHLFLSDTNFLNARFLLRSGVGTLERNLEACRFLLKELEEQQQRCGVGSSNAIDGGLIITSKNCERTQFHLELRSKMNVNLFYALQNKFLPSFF